jgi:hypothetical protein
LYVFEGTGGGLLDGPKVSELACSEYCRSSLEDHPAEEFARVLLGLLLMQDLVERLLS